MLRLATLLLLCPLAASAQTPTALVDLASRPLVEPTVDPQCLPLPGQAPGVIRVLFDQRIPVADALGRVDLPGATARAPRPEVATVYLLDVDVPRGTETAWCERLNATPGVRTARRLGPTVWRGVTPVVSFSCYGVGERETAPRELGWRYQHAAAHRLRR